MADVREIWDPTDPELAGVFAAVPGLVGAPGVHGLWRRLANHPAFLLSVWPSVAASFEALETEDCAQRLRADAFIVEAVGMPSHKAFRGDLVRAEIDAEFRAKIEHFNDISQYALSRLMVIAVSLASPVSTGVDVQPAALTPKFSRLGLDAVYVPPLRPGEGGDKTREILQRVEREHALPFIDDYYRSLGRIPEFLSAAWNAIRPIVGDSAYIDRGLELFRLASETATNLPAGLAASTALAELGGEEALIIRKMLADFSEKVLPQTLIDVTLIKALTSGPQHATSLAVTHLDHKGGASDG
jgi:hypothetical protein